MPLCLVATFAAFGVSGLVVLAVAVIITYDRYAEDFVAPEVLAINQPSYGARILDRNGRELYEYVDDEAGLRRPIKLEDVSEAFLAATIATEDNSFFTNPGVNVKGLLRAAWENSPFSGTELFSGSGGSSITQQLVKNVYIDEESRQERWSTDGINRKIKETFYALELTQRYSKERILEWYVNEISYGGVYYGVEAAARGYFGKPAKDLTLAEAALVAGIPQSPLAYDPVTRPEEAEARRNEILDLMVRQGRIQIGEKESYEVTPEAFAQARAEPIEARVRRFPIEAPHWVLTYIEPQLRTLLDCPQLTQLYQEVIDGKREPPLRRPGEGCPSLFTDGLVVTTTLDLELQKEIQQIMEGWILEFEAVSNSHNGSMMLIDPKSGEILVMIGSRDYFRDDIDGSVNNVLACNSPGSSFKPFAYLTSFLELGWGPGTLILDTPVTYVDDLGRAFIPTNPGRNFRGPVTLRFALGNSLNVPANKTAAAVGAQSIVNLTRKLGFVDTFSRCSAGGGYGPAIATGGVDVTLEEMMYGYGVLANGGMMRGQVPITDNGRLVDAISVLKIVDSNDVTRFDIEEHRAEQRVVDSAYAYLVWDILSDPNAHCVTFGACGAISISGYKAGVKTGTSEPFDRDDRCAGKIGETWAFGYSPDLVVGIWAGNADNDCIVDIVSTSIAYRAMRDAFRYAHRGIEATSFDRPADVVEVEICLPSGRLPTEHCGRKSKDLFVKDRVPVEMDTWWQPLRIDMRNGLLASANTPDQFVEEKVMLVLPFDLMQTEEDKRRALEMASALNLPLAPTETSKLGSPALGGASTDLPAIIVSPSAEESLSGLVQITGRAISQDFKYYRLEYASGAAPRSWSQVLQAELPVQSGTLGVWNTLGLVPGVYTLRLVVEDVARGQFTASVIVQVNGNNGPGVPTVPPQTP
ncbi:MAG: hypothetical protein GEU75_10145 [Dehalococcoidia bacterium]|nr:hypothetical protein [Dehalococcoidia bacterium]